MQVPHVYIVSGVGFELTSGRTAVKCLMEPIRRVRHLHVYRYVASGLVDITMCALISSGMEKNEIKTISSSRIQALLREQKPFSCTLELNCIS